MQPPSQHARMNVELPSHGHQAVTHCTTRMRLAHHPYDLLLGLRSNECLDMLAQISNLL